MSDRLLIFNASNPLPPYLEPETRRSIFDLRWEGPFEVLHGHNHQKRKPNRSEKIRDVADKYIQARKVFLVGGYSLFFSVDSDMVLPPDALISMAAVDADVVYGLYCSRPLEGHPWMIRLDDALKQSDYTPLERARFWGKVVPSKGLGMGCTLIHRPVLERIDFRGGEMFNDWYFAKDCIAAGFRQAHDCRVICGHISQDQIIWPHRKNGFRLERRKG